MASAVSSTSLRDRRYRAWLLQAAIRDGAAPTIVCDSTTMTMRSKRWSELGPTARVLVVAAAVMQFGLLGAALADLRRRSPDQVRGPRWAWGTVSLINFVGPISYFAFGRRRGHR